LEKDFIRLLINLCETIHSKISNEIYRSFLLKHWAKLIYDIDQSEEFCGLASNKKSINYEKRSSLKILFI